MKLLILITLVSIPVYACDQRLYDEFYKAIVMRAIHSKLTQEDIDLKNDAIVTLRRLCNGQLSSWELGQKEKK